MTLDVAIEYRIGDFHLVAEFSTGAGITALFGPSGSGKTSLVNVIAGLVRPQAGRLVVDGQVLVDIRAGVFVPAHRRPIAYVFQDSRLFPHLSVRQNLVYGRWFRRRERIASTFDEVVELLDLQALLQRAPRGLSGGEQQRVAIGRALLASPRLLLLDEPLAALDAPRRAEVLPYIERLRDQLRMPMVYVSHAVAEVARLASQVIVLERGRVTANASAADVFAGAPMRLASGEAGSLLNAVVVDHDEDYALTRLRTAGGDLLLPRAQVQPGASVHVHIRARDVMLATSPTIGLSAQNILPAVVVEVRERGAHAVDVRLDCCGETLLASVTRRAAAQLGIVPGLALQAIIKSVAIDGEGLGIAAAVTESDRLIRPA